VVASDGTPCTDGSHIYTTVTAALAASNAGDRIVVCPGHYAESVTVERAVRLESFAGPSRTYLHSTFVGGDGARVAGFRLHELTVEAGVEVELLGNVILGNSIYLPLVLKTQ
jgi:hypothetical protein